MKIMLVLISVLLAFSMLSCLAKADTIVLDSTNGGTLGDSYIFKGGADANSGAKSDMRVYADSSSAQRTFILGGLTAIPDGANITGAILSCYISDFGGSAFQILAYNTTPYNTTGTNVSWNEGTLSESSCGGYPECNLDHNITWNNQPTADILQDNVSSGTDKFVRLNFTITDAVINSFTAGQNVSILLRAVIESGGSIVFFNTIQAGSNIWFIEVTYTAPAPTSIQLFLNGSESNIIWDNSTALNVTALINVSLPIDLYADDVLIQSGDETLENISYWEEGLYNFTAEWVGNDSYSGSSATWWANVTYTPYVPPVANFTVDIRFWRDANMTLPYVDNFLHIYARTYCSPEDLAYFMCVRNYTHADYVNGSAMLNMSVPAVYEFFMTDGHVSYNSTTGEPKVTGRTTYNDLFDAQDINVSGGYVFDYLWNSTSEGNIPFTGNVDWDLWILIGGLMAIAAVSCIVAYYTESAIATIVCVIIAYIILKLLHVMVGGSLWSLI